MRLTSLPLGLAVAQCPQVSGKHKPHAGRARAPFPVPPSPPAIPAGGSPAFSRALWRIASADVTAGNAVKLYDDGDETFDAMIALIDGATKCVSLESYILKSDSVGERFASALTRAAARGVRTRLLADWVGMRGLSSKYLRGVRKGGVEVRVFSPPGFRSWLGIVPRDHRKLLVVDDAAGITGGIGIGEEWQHGLIRKRRQAWRDTCVRIVGDAGAHMGAAFDHMWNRAAGQRPEHHLKRLRRPTSGSSLEACDHPPSLVGIVEGEPGRLRVGRALHLQAAAAQRSIWIASAYFIPSFAEVDALAGASRDGVDVRLLVPSKYDHPWIHRITRGFYRQLLRNGVRIWEWGGDMMHAKTAVVDGRWIRVGSTDFNPLGVAINYELDAMIDDPTVGAQAERMFERDLAESRQIKHSPAP